jgi:hypothetical protein
MADNYPLKETLIKLYHTGKIYRVSDDKEEELGTIVTDTPPDTTGAEKWDQPTPTCYVPGRIDVHSFVIVEVSVKCEKNLAERLLALDGEEGKYRVEFGDTPEDNPVNALISGKLRIKWCVIASDGKPVFRVKLRGWM